MVSFQSGPVCETKLTNCLISTCSPTDAHTTCLPEQASNIYSCLHTAKHPPSRKALRILGSNALDLPKILKKHPPNHPFPEIEKKHHLFLSKNHLLRSYLKIVFLKEKSSQKPRCHSTPLSELRRFGASAQLHARPLRGLRGPGAPHGLGFGFAQRLENWAGLGLRRFLWTGLAGGQEGF